MNINPYYKQLQYHEQIIQWYPFRITSWFAYEIVYQQQN